MSLSPVEEERTPVRPRRDCCGTYVGRIVKGTLSSGVANKRKYKPGVAAGQDWGNPTWE